MAQKNNKSTDGDNLTPQNLDLSQTGELQVSSQVAGAMQEIQMASFLAKRFPRDYNKVWADLQRACKKGTLAKKAEYVYPRSGKDVRGVSVYLAREAALCYTNMRYGATILRDDEDSRTIEGWAWDVETNHKVQYPYTFKKLVYRKKGGWIKPDERDLRELTFKYMALCIRNAILSVIRSDLIEDAVGTCNKTIKDHIKDVDGEKKHLIADFEGIGVTVEMVNKYLGTKSWTVDDIIKLQKILNAISDGQAKVKEYFGNGQTTSPEPAKGTMSAADMKPGDKETHQGYDDPPKKETEQSKPQPDPQPEKSEKPKREKPKKEQLKNKQEQPARVVGGRDDLELNLFNLINDNEQYLWPALLAQYPPEKIKGWSVDEIKNGIKTLTPIIEMAKKKAGTQEKGKATEQEQLDLSEQDNPGSLPDKADF